MLIIPAIDIKNGKSVYTQLGTDPVKIAEHFASKGAQIIHMVDIDAVMGTGTNKEVIKAIVSRVPAKYEVNAGPENAYLKTLNIWQTIITPESDEEVESVVTKYPDLSRITASFSFDESLEQQSAVYKNAQILFSKGVQRYIFRSSQFDGKLQGLSLELAAEFKKLSGTEVIVSGGVSSLEDISKAKERCIDAVIVGRALYEKQGSETLIGNTFTLP